MGKKISKVGHSFDLLIYRLISFILAPLVIKIQGLKHISNESDPFILVLNHNNSLETLVLLSYLGLHRNGKRIHFAVDWMFGLLPIFGRILARTDPIWVTKKSAKPSLLNIFRRKFMQSRSVLDQMAEYLIAGQSIGLFPEGRRNRDLSRLLPVHRSAAYLALRCDVPLIPAGIRFPELRKGENIGTFSRMELIFGRPIETQKYLDSWARKKKTSPTLLLQIEILHNKIMTEISRLCNKSFLEHRFTESKKKSWKRRFLYG